MSARPRQRNRLLHAFMVAMLMFGIVAKPVMSVICDAHALTHLIASSEHVDSHAEQQNDADHASGAHQFVHSGDTTPAYAEPLATLTVPAIPYADAAPMPAADATPPTRRNESPFRPPIA